MYASLSAQIADLRAHLAKHELYMLLNSHRNMALFMEHHVWAVWDFMSLVKSLQRTLTCVDVPWIPVGDPEIRYLINDIVVGEESDVDRQGRRSSHFEMYLAAMRGLGAKTRPVEHFLGELKRGLSLEESLSRAGAPAAAADFVRFTFEIIRRGRIHEIAGVFTFGREDLIPTMFLGILDRLGETAGIDTRDLRYYLERHVEVDGGHHGPLARRMIESLIGTSESRRNEAGVVARQALEHRLRLWDAVVSCCTGVAEAGV